MPELFTESRAPEYADLGAVLAGMAEIVKPPPQRTADQWADENRILPPGSAQPGPWRTDLVPYMRDIYRAFSDPRFDEVIAVMGAQMSKTELILNVFGHMLTDGPYVPALYVGPTQKHVTSMSRDRVHKMVQSTPELLRRLHKGQEDKVSEKVFAGIRLGFAWAGSATELASHPAGLVILDERDRMDNDIGGEGDPYELAKARGETYDDFKIGAVSTPTLEGHSPIWILYEGGTMMKWALPCLHCRRPFVPYSHLLIYPKDADDATIEKAARVVCPNCGGEHSEKHKKRMNADGVYLPHAIGENGEHVEIEQPARSSRASYWVSGLCSPFTRAAWGKRAVALAKAYRTRNQQTLQTVINTRFGEPFRIKGEAPPWETVKALAQPIARGEVPSWATLLAMGTDVQKDGLHYVVRAYGFDTAAKASRSHCVDDGFIFGDTEFDDVWIQWQAVLNTVYGDLEIGVSLVDSGYNPARDRFRRPEHKVYQICQRTNWRALPSKGHDTAEKIVSMSKLERSPRGKTMPGLRLWHINTDHFKTKIHSLIRVSADQDDPVWSLHAEIDDDYCRQIVAEELGISKSGKRIWMLPNHRDNHKLDCEVLCEAGATIYAAKTRESYTIPAKQPKKPARAPSGFVSGGAQRRPAPGGKFIR